MKKMLISFLLGLIAGAAGLWYLQQNNPGWIPNPSPGVAANNPASGTNGASRDLRMDELKTELERTGTIIREKTRQAGAVIADAAGNARITASIKGRLLTDMGSEALSINVDTTDGLVTLSGNAQSHEQVAKAVRIALDTEGVVKVISTLQIKAPAKK